MTIQNGNGTISSSNPLHVTTTSGGVSQTVNADGSTNVVVTGSSVTEVTVVNAVSIAAGAFAEFSLTPTTEDEIWILVSIDKQPWSMSTSTYPFSGSDGGNGTVYPTRVATATTHSTSSPAVSLFIGGVNTGTSWGTAAVGSMLEAKQYKIIPYKANAKGRITNQHATDTATVTVKLLRIWKKGA